MTETARKIIYINIYTDGACSGNPGPGGWGALLLIKSGTKKEKVVIKGGEKHTTNNRMELTAVIEALKWVYKNLRQDKYMLDIRLYSDSSYIVNSVNGGSLVNWQNNGWKTTKNTDVVNRDLWEKLIKLDDKLSVSFKKVKGHSGNKFNDYVDNIAVKECNKYKKILNKL